MKKLNVSPPAEVALTVEGNSIKVISLSLPQRAQIGATEERLAWRIARKDLEAEKEDLQAEPFDAQAWAQNWCETNYPNIEITNGTYSTWYAKHNNGKKPPQNLYEVLVKEKAESYAIYAICHYFIRDENGEMLFDPTEDFKNVSYSPSRQIMNEWLTTNKELQELVRECNYGTLMGFIEAKAQAKKAQELQKTQDNGEKELQLPEHVDTE